MTEEADETLFWFELLVEAELVKMKVLDSLMKECEEAVEEFFPHRWLRRSVIAKSPNR